MIREVREEDVPELCRMYNTYITDTVITFETEPLSEEQYLARVREVTEKYPWIVLEENGEVLGFAYLASFNSRPAYDWTADLSVYLRHDVRGKGYGKQLMDEILKRGKEQGFRKAVSLITSSNEASVRFHERAGFTYLCRMENAGYKMGQWLSVDWYVLDLGEYETDPVRPAGFEGERA